MNSENRSETLEGRRILVVEDEYYLADDIVRALRDCGAEIVGPVATLDQAEKLVSEGGLDCAILDLNLRGEMSFPVADALTGSGIPFLIATGYDSAAIPERFSSVPRIQKPADARMLASLVPGAIADRQRRASVHTGAPGR
jgi:DNA-binding NtrC family response regulator